MDRLQLIQALLIKADALYQSGKSAPEIAALAAIWVKPVSCLTDAALREAMDHHFQRGAYFPRPADIVTAAEESAAQFVSRSGGLELPPVHPRESNPHAAAVVRAGKIRRDAHARGEEIGFRESYNMAVAEMRRGSEA